jgi:hypothetical protein
MTTYVRFIENNDNEGETWNFWLQRDGNETQLARLNAYLQTANEDNPYEDEFSMTDDELTTTQVDLLVRFAEDGYMASHNKITGRLELPDDFESEKDAARHFYKGDIRNFFTAQES